jgi:hypothetical protein
MLFRPATLEGIADGSVTLAFRRWPQPRVKAGGEQRTSIGVVAFDAVEPVDRDDIGETDARAAGFATLDELLAFVDRRTSGTIYRIRLGLAGPDPRVALREALPDSDQVEQLTRRLQRLDRASRHGPWTAGVLRTIRDQPGVRAADLAVQFGRERAPFKLDVRKLKELGLTESLPRGYRITPRGLALLDQLDARPASQRPRTTRRRPA